MAKRTGSTIQTDEPSSSDSAMTKLQAEHDALIEEFRDLQAAHETLRSEHESLLAITTETQLPLEVHCIVMDWIAQSLHSHNIRHLMLAASEQMGIEAVEVVRDFLLARCKPNMQGQVRLQFRFVQARWNVRQHELKRGKTVQKA